MNKQKELAKNTLILTLGKICTQCISFFLLPLYTALLNPDEYGIVDLFNTYISLLLPLVNWSVDLGIFRYMIEYRENKDKQKALFSSVIFMNLVQSFIYGAFFLIVQRYITSPYKVFLAISVILNVFSSTLLQFARGIGDNTGYTLASVLSALGNILLNIITIVFFKMGAWGLFYGTVGAQVIAVVFIIIREKAWRYVEFSQVNRYMLKNVRDYSIPLVPAQLSWWVVGVSDRTIISFFMGIAANGVYSVANKFSTLIATFYNIFNMTWSESVSLHFNDEDRDEFLSETFDLVLTLFISVCLCLIAFMPIVFPIMVGSQYDAGYYQIPILVIAVLFQVITGLYSVVYLAIKKTKESAKTALLAAIINIGINLIFINYIGLYAASISTLISYLAMAVYRHIDVKKYVNITLNRKKIIKSSMMLLFIVVLYYWRNKYGNICGMVVSVVYTWMENQSILKSVLRSLAKYAKKK